MGAAERSQRCSCSASAMMLLTFPVLISIVDLGTVDSSSSRRCFFLPAHAVEVKQRGQNNRNIERRIRFPFHPTFHESLLCFSPWRRQGRQKLTFYRHSWSLLNDGDSPLLWKGSQSPETSPKKPPAPLWLLCLPQRCPNLPHSRRAESNNVSRG